MNSAGVYGTQGVSTSYNQPRARYQQCTWTDAAGNFWMFGGTGYTSNTISNGLNDLWKYDVNSGQWTWMKGSNSINKYGVYGTKGIAAATNSPGAINNAMGWADTLGNLWLFGGYGYAAASWGYLNDLWKFNIATNQWTWVSGDSVNNKYGVFGTQGIPSVSNKPSARYGGFSWADKAGNGWIFGGYGVDASATKFNLMSDLWNYNVVTSQWTWVKGDDTLSAKGWYGIQGVTNTSNKPGARNFATGWKDANDNLWLFGGTLNDSSGYGYSNDLWKYNISDNKWTWIKGDTIVNKYGFYGLKGDQQPVYKPGGRTAAISWTDLQGDAWVLGGYGFAGGTIGYMNDLWKYNAGNNLWSWINGDSLRNTIASYGTQGFPQASNIPGARANASGWTDVNGKLWMFGGFGYANSLTTTGWLNDLWSFTPGIVLPVHLISFDVMPAKDKTSIEWTVAYEQNFDRYQLERRTGVEPFTSIYGAKATQQKQYICYDNANAYKGRKVYYRLKLISKDGTFTYSKVAVVSIPADHKFTIYPNPASTSLHLQLNQIFTGKVVMKITNVGGNLILQKEWDEAQNTISISTADIPAGVYTVQLSCNNECYLQMMTITK